LTRNPVAALTFYWPELGRQSEPYGHPIELDEALDKARRELTQAPTLVPDE
jgi:pyridoxine/pyridoxamine 5'-phosphate oxidase